MKAVFNVVITKPGGGVEIVRKEVNLPFAPNIGMEIWCAVWDSERKVEKATLYFDRDEYEVECLYLDMGMIETKNEGELEQLIERYKADDWTLAGE